MKKMAYEKPLMLVENFVATQSVVAACDSNDLLFYEERRARLGEQACSKSDCKNGHIVQQEFMERYNGNWDGNHPKGNAQDDYVSVFGEEGGCTEVIFGKDVTSLTELGRMIFGASAWKDNSGNPHAPYLDGKPIAS